MTALKAKFGLDVKISGMDPERQAATLQGELWNWPGATLWAWWDLDAERRLYWDVELLCNDKYVEASAKTRRKWWSWRLRVVLSFFCFTMLASKLAAAIAKSKPLDGGTTSRKLTPAGHFVDAAEFIPFFPCLKAILQPLHFDWLLLPDETTSFAVPKSSLNFYPPRLNFYFLTVASCVQS